MPGQTPYRPGAFFVNAAHLLNTYLSISQTKLFIFYTFLIKPAYRSQSYCFGELGLLLESGIFINRTCFSLELLKTEVSLRGLAIVKTKRAGICVALYIYCGP